MDQKEEKSESIKSSINTVLNAIIPNFDATNDKAPCTELQSYVEDFFRKRSDDLIPPIYASLKTDKLHLRDDWNLLKDERKAALIDFFDDHYARQSLDDANELNANDFTTDRSAAAIKYSVKAKKIMAARAKRRCEAENVVIIQLKGDEGEILRNFYRAYQVLLSIHSSSLTIFYTIINSLQAYYRTQTWDDLVERYIAEFLIQTLHRDCNWMARHYDMATEDVDYTKVVLDYETRVLVDLHIFSCLQQNKNIPWRHFSVEEIILKCRFIYAAGAAIYLKKFLDEVVCDAFAHFLPHKVAEIYNEECLKMPLDIEERINGGECRQIAIPTRVIPYRAHSNHALCRATIEEKQKCALEMASTSSTEDCSRTLRLKRSSSPTPKKKVILKPKTKSIYKMTAKKTTANTAKRKQSSSTFTDVHEIPEVKIRKKDVALENETVSSPEVPKLRIPRARKFAHVVGKQVAQLAKRKGYVKIRKGKALIKQKAKQKKSVQMQRLSRSKANRVRKSHQPCMVHPSPKKRILGISRRLSKPTSAVAFDGVDNNDSNGAENTDVHTASAQTQIISCRSEEYSPDDEVLVGYLRRVESAKSLADEANTDEIFYGRHTMRHTLFNSGDTLATKESSELLKSVSKNRSGRSVRSDSSRVFMAHTLLNGRNRDPLQLHRSPRRSHEVVRLSRLIRPASKADRKRREKFCIKIKREQSGFSSNIVKSPSSNFDEAEVDEDLTYSCASNCSANCTAEREKNAWKGKLIHEDEYQLERESTQVNVNLENLCSLGDSNDVQGSECLALQEEQLAADGHQKSSDDEKAKLFSKCKLQDATLTHGQTQPRTRCGVMQRPRRS